MSEPARTKTMNPPSSYLHLGCGLTSPPGWLNVDGSFQVVLARNPWLKKLLVASGIFPKKQAELPWSPRVQRINLSNPLPYPSNFFKAVYCSHTLEHLYKDDAAALLRECLRVLSPGGVCRFVVPDLEATIERYHRAKATGDKTAADRFMQEMLVHDTARKKGLLGWYHRLTAFHPHKWMYDAESLKVMFAAAGFVSVGRKDFLESKIDLIADVENKGRILDGQGIAIEGLKA